MRKNLGHLLLGLVVVALLIFIKSQVEHSRYGLWFNARGYEILHSFIPTYNPDEDPSVIVLDISDLKRDANDATPQESLQEIVMALLESKAKAIAIDVDFTPHPNSQDPTKTGPRTNEDPDFFEFLHGLKNKGAHVFVGAKDFGVEPETWLGADEDKDLAVDITVIEENTTEVPAWLQCDNIKLKSISRALADAYGTHPPPPAWLNRVLTNYEDPENLKEEIVTDNSDNKVTCPRAFTLVNYAKLELIQKLTLQTLNRDSILVAKNVDGTSKFLNKMVIVGNGQPRAGEIQFVVPGRSKAVAGIYIHASAAHTLAADPVYKFKYRFAIFLDGLLGSLVVLGLFIVRLCSHKESNFSEHRWENRFVLISIVLTLSLGLIMVKLYNVLWLDFLLVIFALLLHSTVQNGLVYFPRRLFGQKAEATSKEES